MKNEGWSVKRREASEKTRKGKCYFIDVVYTMGKKKRAAVKKEADSDKKPAAKKTKLGDSTNAAAAVPNDE